MNIQSNYSVSDLAKGFHVSDQTVRRWIKEKRLNGIKVSYRFLIPDSELRKFLGDGYSGIMDDSTLPPVVDGKQGEQ